MTPADGDRLRHFLQPLPVLLGLKDAFSILARRQLSRWKVMGLGIGQEASIPSPQYLPTNLGKLDDFNDTLRREPESAPNDDQKEDSLQPTMESVRRPRILAWAEENLVPGLSHGSDLQVAARAFRWRLRDCKARETPTPRRGSMTFTGPITIRGSRGYCRVDVRGEYHPATSSWTDVSIQLKELIPNRVSPIGEPKGQQRSPGST